MNAIDKFCKHFELDHKKVAQFLQKHDINLDFEKVEAVGYQGAMALVYRRDVRICPCCKGYYNEDYYNECSECGALERCYECATGGNDCENVQSDYESEEDSSNYESDNDSE